MEEISPPSPVVNTLDVDEQRTYADTSIETWQIIKFFLEGLQPVRIADLEPGDCQCDICTEDFAEDLGHRAVRLSCGHIFGEQCLKIWLSPYAPCMPIKRVALGVPVGANTCPKCRRVFFPEQKASDILPAIEARIKFWDKVYTYVGIALSERERQAREDLLQYLGRYPTRGLDEYYPNYTSRSGPQSWAHKLLLRFSLRIKRRNLTPVQEHLRQGVEDVAKFDFRYGSRWRKNDRGEMFFEVKEDPEIVSDSKSHESHESLEEVKAEEESEELTGGDTEQMRFL